MITNFNEQIFVDFKSIDIAVFIENIAYWIRKNSANKRHFYDGRTWSYNSFEAFTKMFPGWSIQTVRTIIKKCVKHELLIIGNYNIKSYDKTNWYTLTDKALAYFPALQNLRHDLLDTPHNPHPDSSVNINVPSVEINTPIPKLLTTTRNINITRSCEHGFETFWKTYPSKKAQEYCKKIWIKKKLGLISDEIIEALERQLAEDKNFIEGFILNPAKYLNESRWTDEITPVKSQAEKIKNIEAAKLAAKAIEDKQQALRDERNQDIARRLQHRQDGQALRNILEKVSIEEKHCQFAALKSAARGNLDE